MKVKDDHGNIVGRGVYRSWRRRRESQTQFASHVRLKVRARPRNRPHKREVSEARD